MCVLIGIAQHATRFHALHINFLPLLDLFVPVPTQLSGKQYTGPATNTTLGTIQTHGQAITVQPGTHSLLGPECIYRCSALSKDTAAAETRIPKTKTQDPKWRAAATTSRCLVCIWDIYIDRPIYSDIGALRVVTARELIVRSSSFTPHSKLVRRLRHLSEPRDIHSLQC